jgi:hypothetical protein
VLFRSITLAERRDVGMIRRIERFTTQRIEPGVVAGLEPRLAPPTDKPLGERKPGGRFGGKGGRPGGRPGGHHHGSDAGGGEGGYGRQRGFGEAGHTSGPRRHGPAGPRRAGPAR